MNITLNLPHLVFPDDLLAYADRLEAEAMQTDNPDETARLMRLANDFRNVKPGEVSPLDESGAITPTTPEDHTSATYLMRLEYDLGHGRQIDLGCYNLSVRDLKVAAAIAEKSEGEFRRLLAELEAAVQDENQDD